MLVADEAWGGLAHRRIQSRNSLANSSILSSFQVQGEGTFICHAGREDAF